MSPKGDSPLVLFFMDWNNTDPSALRLVELPQPQTNMPYTVPQTEADLQNEMQIKLQPDLQAEMPNTMGSTFREPNNASHLFDVSGTVQGKRTAPTASLLVSPTHGTEIDMAVATDIWQRLSTLVRSSPRALPGFNGPEPLLTSAVSLALLAGVAITGNFWLVCAWALITAAAVQVITVKSIACNAQDALTMAPFDLRWVGPLTHALNSPHSRVRGVASQLLTHLLPYLRPDTAYLLNRQQRAYLNQSLIRNRRRDSALNMAILEAWAWIGDAAALPYVERLARSKSWSSERFQVREAADACLIRLESRLEERETARSLGTPEAEIIHMELSTSTRAAIANVDTQLEKLREERRTHSNPGMRLGFLIASWAIIVPYMSWMSWTLLSGRHWQAGIVSTFLTLLATQLHRFSLSNKQTEAAKRLANTDDIRAVGPLAEALDWPDASIQRVAAQGLTRLLPRLTASDAHLLNVKQRASLYHLLKMRYAGSHHLLIEATLKALQQIGDAAAVTAVERLSKARAYTDRQRRLKQLAEDTLPLLTISAQKQGASSQLLRASSAHETPSDLLLRGAMEATEEAPQQLLRPSTSQDNV